MTTSNSQCVPLPEWPARAAESHKGDFGRALIVGGNRDMSGAVALAGKAALRGGAGLVTLAVPRGCQTIVAGHEPSYMTRGLPEDEAGRMSVEAAGVVMDQAAACTALALGPGLGRSEALNSLVWQIYEQATLPMVVDADGLNALSENRDLLGRSGGPRILTPHPGEFSRLVPEEGNKIEQAVELACAAGVVVVLKGHRTLVTDGAHRYFNTTGNPGMATGGMGDVLTGLIVALLCQGFEAFAAARLAVNLHGRAGDLAAGHLGEVSLIAADLLDYLPAAIRSHQR